MNKVTREKVKRELYNRCQMGEISINQRETLLQKLSEKNYENYLFEKALEEIDRPLKPKKRTYKENPKVLFERAKSEIYTRHAKGEISLTQREDLIAKARKEFMTT